MEANEVQELKEHAEHGAQESTLRPVAFTMSVLAVLVAVTTVLGHRTHTEAVLAAEPATDQWNEYQAKKIRSYNTRLADDLLSAVTVADKDKAAKISKAYADHQAKWNDDLKEDQEKAKALEEKVEQAEARAESLRSCGGTARDRAGDHLGDAADAQPHLLVSRDCVFARRNRFRASVLMLK